MSVDVRKSWTIKGAGVVTELLAWMDLTEGERRLLSGLRDAAVAAAPAFAEECCARILDSETTQEYAAAYPRGVLAGALSTWFTDLFNGVYDEDYAKSRIRMGEAQMQLGLPVRYPIALLDIACRHGEAVASTAGPEATQAFRKALALDVAAIMQAHEEQQIQHLSETVGNERLARRLLTQR